MSWITGLAIYFVIWWTVLFAILPIGIRSQAEDDSVVLGTPHSAPTQFSMPRKALWTTLVSALVFAAYYIVTVVYGISANSFPSFLPSSRG